MATKERIGTDKVHDFARLAHGARGQAHPFSRLLHHEPAPRPQSGWNSLPAYLTAQPVVPFQGRTYSSPALQDLDLSLSSLQKTGASLGMGLTLGASTLFHPGQRLLQLTPSGAEAAVLLSTYLPEQLKSAAPIMLSLWSQKGPAGTKFEPEDVAFALLLTRLCDEGINGLFHDLRLNAKSISWIYANHLSMAHVQQAMFDQQGHLLRLLYSGHLDSD